MKRKVVRNRVKFLEDCAGKKGQILKVKWSDGRFYEFFNGKNCSNPYKHFIHV